MLPNLPTRLGNFRIAIRHLSFPALYLIIYLGPHSLLPYQLYQVEVHQAAVEWSLWLDAPEFALLLLGVEKIIEAVALVESKVALLVVGIDEKEAATRLVERIDEPRFDETEYVAAEMLALEVGADAKTDDSPLQRSCLTIARWQVKDVGTDDIGICSFILWFSLRSSLLLLGVQKVEHPVYGLRLLLVAPQKSKQ